VVCRAEYEAAGRLEVDGAPVMDMPFVLVDDGKTHSVVVRVAGAP